MSPLNENSLLPSAFTPDLSPRDKSKRFAVGAAVLVLHLVLGFLFVVGMRERSSPKIAVKAIELALNEEHAKPPEPLPKPILVAPKANDLSPPQVDIIPTPQSALSSTPQGAMTSLAGGGNGNGGQGIRAVAPPKPPPPPPDPNCETIDDYKARVHRAIDRNMNYPDAAQKKIIQGVIALHFISNIAGNVLVHSAAGIRTMRTYWIEAENGRQIPFTFTFARNGANQWSYDASTQTAEKSPRIVPLPGGTLRADAGGVLDPARIVFEVPQSVASTSNGRMTIELGSAHDLFLLEDRVNAAIENAQPLPAIPACLKLQTLNALMPFGFQLQVPGVLLPP